MFLAPAFLAALLAIGLPVWLHRVARANPPRHPFASLMLLEASETQRTAQRTLRYWMLLALRIALLVALALAFAGPLVSRQAIPVLNPNARLQAVVMDASLSMQYGDRWQRALAQAREVIDAARPGDQILLVEARGRKIQVVHDTASAGRQSLPTALTSIKPGNERLDYGLLMTTARSWLGTARLPVELHLISDLQQSASPMRFSDLEPPADTQLVFHDVGEERADNTYVTQIDAESAARELAVHVRTTSSRIERREMIVLLDDAELGRKSFEVGPAGTVALYEGEGGPPPHSVSAPVDIDGVQLRPTAKVLFASLDLSAGAHRVEVRLEPQDALPADDRFYAVIEHSDPRVLLASRAKDADDAAYMAAAIASLSSPQLTVERRSGQELEGRALQGYSAMVVTDVAALSSAATTRILDYVRSGGALLITLGPGAAEQRSALLDGLRVRNEVSAPTRVAHVETSHPALRDASGWQDVRFFRHLQVTPADGDRILINLQDGTPLLIERSLGAGRMLLLTAPLDRDWNDLATQPLFVRFVAETARYLTRADTSTASARVGSVVMTGLTAAGGGQIFDPQGRRVLNLNQTASSDRMLPDQLGFYEIRGAAGARWVAVNTDARESDLTRLPPPSLQRWQQLRHAPGGDDARAEASDTPRSVSSPAGPGRTSIGYWLLLLATALAVLEIALANRYLAVRREV